MVVFHPLSLTRRLKVTWPQSPSMEPFSSSTREPDSSSWRSSTRLCGQDRNVWDRYLWFLSFFKSIVSFSGLCSEGPSYQQDITNPILDLCCVPVVGQVEDCWGSGCLDPLTPRGGAAQTDHRHPQGHAWPSWGELGLGLGRACLTLWRWVRFGVRKGMLDPLEVRFVNKPGDWVLHSWC